MPKDTRVINGSIRLSKGRGLFNQDTVDEFEEVVTAEEIAQLTENGSIKGFAKAEKAEKAEKAGKTETGDKK